MFEAKFRRALRGDRFLPYWKSLRKLDLYYGKFEEILVLMKKTWKIRVLLKTLPQLIKTKIKSIIAATGRFRGLHT